MKELRLILAFSVLSFLSCAIALEPKGLSLDYYRLTSLASINEEAPDLFEIRFYNIEGATEVAYILKKEYGEHDLIKEGKYQDNIEQKIWNDIDLLEDGVLYKLVSDGSEDLEAFFSSVMVFDVNGNDALAKGIKVRGRIIKKLVRLMKESSK